jgi:luciferase family oxidoreductase group 1
MTAADAMRISVLDQSGVAAGQPPAAAIRDSVRLAMACDRLGYHRYWVSEHHNSEGIAGTAPEVLLGHLAAVTRRIRIGSAGIMLPHYAPLKVAEQFRVLEALAPGRIDLGMGRGPGADRHTSYALKPAALDNPLAMATADSFPQDVADVIAWTRGAPLAADHPFAGIRAQPSGDSAPQHWIVGSTAYTARLASQLGLPYCFAHFFNDGDDADAALGLYRESFRPSLEARALPAICVWAAAAPTSGQAEALFMPYALWRARRQPGRTAPFPAPGQFAATCLSAQERATIDRLRERVVFGTPDDVASRLAALAGAFGVNELVVITNTCDPADRQRSYELIAQAMDLSSRLRGGLACRGAATACLPA